MKKMMTKLRHGNQLQRLAVPLIQHRPPAELFPFKEVTLHRFSVKPDI